MMVFKETHLQGWTAVLHFAYDSGGTGLFLLRRTLLWLAGRKNRPSYSVS